MKRLILKPSDPSRPIHNGLINSRKNEQDIELIKENQRLITEKINEIVNAINSSNTQDTSKDSIRMDG